QCAREPGLCRAVSLPAGREKSSSEARTDGRRGGNSLAEEGQMPSGDFSRCADAIGGGRGGGNRPRSDLKMERLKSATSFSQAQEICMRKKTNFAKLVTAT